MGSALPADTEASDTPDSVYREQFPRDHRRQRSSSLDVIVSGGIRIAGLEMLTSGRRTFPGPTTLKTRTLADLATMGKSLSPTEAQLQRCIKRDIFL